VSFDPFTKDIIMNSAGTIEQFDPVSGTIVSTLTGIGNFDQAAEDGKGHLFVASNSGFLEFVDYDATGLIGAPGNFTAEPFLIANLDDIAPLSGAGSGGTSVPEPEFAYVDGFGIIRTPRYGKTPPGPIAHLGLVAKDLLTWKWVSPRGITA
jgi:hypothetical protein